MQIIQFVLIHMQIIHLGPVHMVPFAEMSRLWDGYVSVRSYGFFHPACLDEILLLALAKHVHFSHATQLFNNFGVFLYLFASKSIALAR